MSARACSHLPYRRVHCTPGVIRIPPDVGWSALREATLQLRTSRLRPAGRACLPLHTAGRFAALRVCPADRSGLAPGPRSSPCVRSEERLGHRPAQQAHMSTHARTKSSRPLSGILPGFSVSCRYLADAPFALHLVRDDGGDDVARWIVAILSQVAYQGNDVGALPRAALDQGTAIVRRGAGLPHRASRGTSRARVVAWRRTPCAVETARGSHSGCHRVAPWASVSIARQAIVRSGMVEPQGRREIAGPRPVGR